jgi:hypothetical protein
MNSLRAVDAALYYCAGHTVKGLQFEWSITLPAVVLRTSRGCTAHIKLRLTSDQVKKWQGWSPMCGLPLHLSFPPGNLLDLLSLLICDNWIERFCFILHKIYHINKMQNVTYEGRSVSAMVKVSDPAVAQGSLVNLFPWQHRDSVG